MNFIKHMLDFYGINGIYPEVGATDAQVVIATEVYKYRLAVIGEEFVGDSVDRERVRDIILEARESILPEFTKA